MALRQRQFNTFILDAINIIEGRILDNGLLQMSYRLTIKPELCGIFGNLSSGFVSAYVDETTSFTFW